MVKHRNVGVSGPGRESIELPEGAPPYLRQIVERHGPAASRLAGELADGVGDFADSDHGHAVAFDAADFAWTALLALGYTGFGETREVRNCVAEAIARELQRILAEGRS